MAIFLKHRPGYLIRNIFPKVHFYHYLKKVLDRTFGRVVYLPEAQCPSAVPELAVHSVEEMQVPFSVESDFAVHSLFWGEGI